ncbi:glycosyltransferase [Candidatus Saccharibacteria bacterium]|nr:glycosyltransferase [Candidatus Saccharibacteria bacterium]
MKIAFFSDCYLDLTGGIVSSINAQKKALEKLGHEVYIFSTSFPKNKHETGVLAEQNIYTVPSCKLFFRGLTPVSRRPAIIEKWILKHHPEVRDFDVFYVHYEAGCSIAGLRLARKLGVPSVQVMHGREDMGETNIIPFGFRTIVAILLNWFHSWYLPHPVSIRRDNRLADTVAKAKMWTMMVNHANFADQVITPSEHFRQELLKYGVTKSIEVCPNGFNDEKFPQSPKPKRLKGNEELKMVWHSRVSAEKRIMPFLRALTMVEGKWHLDVYGGGGELKKAKRFVHCHHLNVSFYGDTPFEKLAPAINTAHLDVLVSYGFDTFGMTLIEAEAYGVPVFICDPDLKEAVPEGSYIIAKSETPAAMAEALNYVIQNPIDIQHMSEMMLVHRDEILISHRIKKLVKVFRAIIKS